jgi:hypothetical protein
MTAILGTIRSGFAVLVMDSAATLTHPDGRVEYDARESIPFRALPGGFVAACGQAPVGWAALAALAGPGPLSLAEAVSRCRASVEDAAAAFNGRAKTSAVHLLTIGSGRVELGTLYGDGRLLEHDVGSNVFHPPAGADRASSIARFRQWEGEAQGRSGHDRIRAIARLFRDLAAATPTVSGRVRLGLLQRPPGSEWIAAHLVADARELAGLSDPEISRRVLSC